ncbi:MAG: magnesium transporter [Victivallales bacterium]|nr:magnesium transporter [Victivallales bacterium]
MSENKISENLLEDVNVGIPEEVEKAIVGLSEANNIKELRSTLEAMNPADAASALELLTPEQQVTVFLTLPKDIGAEIFTYVDSDIRVRLVQYIASPGSTDKIRQDFINMFEDLAADDAIDVLDELPANLVEELLSRCTRDRREQLNAILKYPPNSAGSLMTVEYIILPETMTVAGALAQIRRQGKRKETINYCYAVGAGRKLSGVLSLKTILLSDENVLIKDIMTSPVIFAYTHEDQEVVAAKVKKYDLQAIPVVDKEERMVGIITGDDIMDVVEKEDTEDFEKMAAMEPAKDEYMKSGIFVLARNRIKWLIILMVSSTLTGFIITRFNNLLASQVILASFIPMLMDTGGNCGAQVSTLMIRGMAVGDIEPGNWAMVVWKELRVALAVGAALCLANIIRMLIFVKELSLPVVLVVNVTLIIIVVFAKIIGCLLPMAAKQLKFDPALMASPMITTIVDAFALFIYFAVAQRILV